MAMDDVIGALLDLQRIDLARDRLYERKEKLPLLAELAEVNARINEVQAAIDRVQREADELEREERRIEEEIRLKEEKISEEERKLYSGQVVNPKELSALTDEIGMLKRQKAPMEERGLEMLETRDQLLDERRRLDDELGVLRREAGEVQEKIDDAVGRIDSELQAEDSKRAEVVPRVPAETLEDYETLREQKKGVGVGALENGICTACREALSAVEVDRIKQRSRAGEWLFRCEHCRRLLVVR